MKLKSKGFTLIELLVVVAIISLLTSIVLASLQEARDKAKLSSIISQIKQVQNALELYRDEEGIYPITNGYTVLNINTNLIPTYLSAYIESLNLPDNLSINYISNQSSLWSTIPCESPSDFDKSSKEYFISFYFLDTNYCYGF